MAHFVPYLNNAHFLMNSVDLDHIQLVPTVVGIVLCIMPSV